MAARGASWPICIGLPKLVHARTDVLRAKAHRPTTPRVNACQDVMDPVCRLLLPTLFYRPEASHLGDLLRIWVRPRAKITPSPSDFHGSTRARRTAQEPRRFAVRREPISGRTDSGLPSDLTKKRELFPGPGPASPSSLASPHSRLWGARSPRRGSGILTRFPFGRLSGGHEAPHFRSAFA